MAQASATPPIGAERTAPLMIAAVEPILRVMGSSLLTSHSLEHRIPGAVSAAVPIKSVTRARLSQVLLLYFLGTIFVMTLAPFQFTTPKHYRVLYTGGAFDIIANVLLFVPLGFLYPLSRPTRDEVSVWRTVLFAALISTSIETIQLFEIERFTSIVDIVTNAAGAGLGALVAGVASRQIKVNAKFVGRLSLEIPLIGLIYLLVPALLVASMDAAANVAFTIGVIPLAFVGTQLIVAVQRNHFARTGLLTATGAGIAAGAWTLLGAFPLIFRQPLLGGGIVIGAAVLTWWKSSRPLDLDGPDRRFEVEALHSVAPHFAAYVLVILVLPLAAGVGPWHARIALTGAGGDIDLQQIQLLVPCSTLTILGYLLAEVRGRLEVPFKQIAARVVTECGVVAVALEVSRGFQRGVGASVSQLVLMLAAGLLGASIYYSQREHVRWILANRRS